jgi:glycosyltransferase involved in cell wall biosynthesis
MPVPFESRFIPSFYWPKSPLSLDLPLVTCIMPTANRIQFIPRAIQYFLQQDYPYKELVIIDDGIKPVLSLIPNLYSIRYFYLKEVMYIGAKRNMACEKACGSIIVHWDDDDWYAPDWITHQVNTLLHSDADICGLSHVKFYSVKDKKFYITKNTHQKKHWLSCATLAYQKSFWRDHQFKNIQIGEDVFFVRNKDAKVIAHGYFDGFLAIVHSTNARIKET